MLMWISANSLESKKPAKPCKVDGCNQADNRQSNEEHIIHRPTKRLLEVIDVSIVFEQRDSDEPCVADAVLDLVATSFV